MHSIDNGSNFLPNETNMKKNSIYSKTETKTKAMKKMSLALVLFCTFNLLCSTACSRGYGCPYTASETISEQPETSATEMAVASEIVLSDELNCLP